MEWRDIDLLVTHSGGSSIIEVKSNPNAALAIREAAGQLLYYAFKSKVAQPRLHVVAPGELDRTATDFLSFVHRQFGMNVRYHSFAAGGKVTSLN